MKYIVFILALQLYFTKSIQFESKIIVKSIPIHDALIVMKKWSLDIKIREENVYDSHIIYPMENTEYQEDGKIKDIIKISDWLSKNKKSEVFASIINENEKMLTFIEKNDKYVRVNGFLSHPFITSEEHEVSRSALALTLLDNASESNENIFFIFSENNDSKIN